MSTPCDNPDEMQDEPVLDEQAVQSILDGSYGAAHLGLARLVDSLRSATTTAPSPSPELASLFAGISPELDAGSSPAVSPRRSPVVRVRSIVAGLSIAGKVMLGAGVAAAATTGAGAAGALPDPVQRQFARVVNPVTPFDVYEPNPVTGLQPAAARAAADPAPPTSAAPATSTTDAAPSTTESAAPAPTEPPRAEVVPAELPLKPVEPTTPPVTAAKPAPEEKPVPEEKPKPTEVPKSTTTKPPSTTTTVLVSRTLSCAQAPTGTAVTCTWTVGQQVPATRLLLVRSGPDGTKTLLETTDLSAAGHVDATAVAGKTYTYVLFAKNDAGQKVGRSGSVKVVVAAR